VGSKVLMLDRRLEGTLPSRSSHHLSRHAALLRTVRALGTLRRNIALRLAGAGEQVGDLVAKLFEWPLSASIEPTDHWTKPSSCSASLLYLSAMPEKTLANSLALSAAILRGQRRPAESFLEGRLFPVSTSWTEWCD
jgi:hypothetical protein